MCVFSVVTTRGRWAVLPPSRPNSIHWTQLCAGVRSWAGPLGSWEGRAQGRGICVRPSCLLGKGDRSRGARPCRTDRGLGPACPKVLAFPRSHTGPVTRARSEGMKAWPEPQSDIPNWGGCELWELRPRIPFQGPQLQSPHSVPTRTPPPTSPCYLLL